MLIQIGFNRCGTKALHQFLVANGVTSLHWDHGKLAVNIVNSMLRDAEPFQAYPGVKAFFDMERVVDNLLIEAFKFYPAMDRAYPEAVFLLNTRSREGWIESRRSHARGEYLRRQRAALGMSETELLSHWRGEWDHHHARVRRFFAGNNRFVEFNVEADDIQKLIDALPEWRLDAALYKRHPNVAISLQRGNI